MKKLIFLFATVMFLSGCVTVKSVNKGKCINDGWGNMVCNNYEVTFVSEPPGAKIEINNNYIGITPLVYRWHGYYPREERYTVKAYPSQPGQLVQSKELAVGNLPDKVYFNMNLGPVTPSVNVNINQ